MHDKYYLAGYRLAAQQLRELRQRAGWATGKGHVKIIVRIWRQQPLLSYNTDHARGYVDAHLDSVGC